MKFAKVVFRVSGIYGLIVLAPMYFLENRIGRDVPPPITHPEYFYGFVGVALAWQLVFLMVATDPARYRPLILPSIVEKITFGIALLVLMSQGRVPASTVALGSIDWMWAVLFSVSYFKINSAQIPA